MYVSKALLLFYTRMALVQPATPSRPLLIGRYNDLLLDVANHPQHISNDGLVSGFASSGEESEDTDGVDTDYDSAGELLQ